jgi:hypothetical protein
MPKNVISKGEKIRDEVLERRISTTSSILTFKQAVLKFPG